MNKDWDEATVEEIEAEIQRLDAERAKLRDQTIDMHKILDEKIESFVEERRLSDMPPARRIAFTDPVHPPEKEK